MFVADRRYNMDILVKNEEEAAYSESPSICLESISDPVVKWVNEENIAVDAEECATKLTQVLFRCEICAYKTLQMQRLEVHLKTHPPDLTVNVKNELYDPAVTVKHEEIMLDDKGHCNDDISLIPKLESHVETHMQGSPVLSSDQDSDSLHTMETEDMLIPKIKQKIGLPERIFTCKLCNYKTLQSQRYRTHIRTHVDRQCFKCNECEHVTPSWESLHRHKLNHAYKCDCCGYKASSKHYLNLHMKIHAVSYSQTFKCDQCQYATVCKSALTCHQKKHVNEIIPIIDVVDDNLDKLRDAEHLKKSDMPFKCEECSYKTLRKDYLDRHMMFHHKNKLLGCSECGQKFALQRSLLLHLKNHVKQEG